MHLASHLAQIAISLSQISCALPQSGLLKANDIAAEIAAVVEMYTGVKEVLPGMTLSATGARGHPTDAPHVESKQSRLTQGGKEL